MKYTINVAPSTDLYYVKKDVQYFLDLDKDAPTTLILLRLNKYVDWDLDESMIESWAKEDGYDYNVQVEKLNRKQHLAYHIKRVA